MTTTVSGLKIIVSHPATNGSVIFITEDCAVHIEHVPGTYITWDRCETEDLARQSANRAWKRFSGREEMICA